METSTIRVGRDGVSLKGRDTIVVGVLLVFACGASWMLWDHVDKDEQRGKAINARMEMIQQDHNLFKSSVDANTSAVERLDKQMELNSWIMLATPQEEKEAKRFMGRPRLLGGNNPYPVRP